MEEINFAEFKDVSLAFNALFSRLQLEVRRYHDFLILKAACVTRANEKLTAEIKKTQDTNSLFELFAENKAHCNWLNIRFLEVIATATGNSKLTGLIVSYKDAIYSKTLREVWDQIPYRTVRTKYYSTLQIKFEGKDPDTVTVGELKRMCEPYLIKEFAMLIAVIEEDSLKITWLIPTNAVYQAYLSASVLPQESRRDSYLQIGDWMIHHPLQVLINLHKEHREYKLIAAIDYHVLYKISLCIGSISPSTLLIGFYHSLLMRDINADLLMDRMSSNGLLAPHDQQLILAGQSMHQRNWLLLEHVRQMEIESLIKLCELMQEMFPQVGLQLAVGMHILHVY